jgi:DNA polymerase IV
MQPIVMHLDMNSYFASVEQQDNPAFRGRPLGVCEHLGGIIIAASIEAKRWGIKTGTPVWEARKLYPKIILSHTHPDRYRLFHKRLVRVVSDYTSYVERYSIDEVFLDITKQCNIKELKTKFQEPDEFQAPNFKSKNGSLKKFYQKIRQDLSAVDPYREAVRIAREIKLRMKREVGDYLTCSVGLAENKLLAKIGSDLKKPDGIVVIMQSRQNEEYQIEGLGAVIFTKSELYSQLKLTDIPGIGRRQEKNLNALGVKTLLDLKNYPKSLLVARFGIVGQHLHTMGQLEGSWKPAVEQDEEIKSIGHMYTLPVLYREREFFVPVLYKLCEMVARRLRRQDLMGNVLHFYLAGKDHEGLGQSKRLGYYLYDGREIFCEAVAMLESFAAAGPESFGGGEYKLIGVTVAGLRPYIRQLSLFGTEEKHRRTMAALDEINSKYGDFTVCRVPVLKAKGSFP